MKTFKFTNKTDETQVLNLKSTQGRGLHQVEVAPKKFTEVDLIQLTPLALASVHKGLFDAVDIETGDPIVSKAPAVVKPAVAPVVPDKKESKDDPEVTVVPDGDKQPNVEEFVCEVCEASFESARALSSHKRSHK